MPPAVFGWYWQPSLLLQLTQQVGGIIRRHAVQDLSRLRVCARLQELRAVLVVQLLEDVGGELDVALNGVEYLLALRMRRALDEVRDLRRMQAAQALEWHQQLRRRHVRHERLHVLPVQERVAPEIGTAAAGDQPPQPGLRAAVHTQEPPLPVHLRQHQIVGAHEMAAGDIDEVPAQHVRRQQHLASAALKLGHVQRADVQLDRVRLQPLHELQPDEHVVLPHPDLEAGDRRVAAVRRG